MTSEHHPLLQYDPEAAKWIKVIKASYFESPDTLPPVPRNQDLPPQAFGELTGRCILAATSHAWFWQNHPDPEGVKLKILREEFIPRLRYKYPDTKIVIFDDWHSCPQWPRTKEEDIIFYKAMEHMNSMYVYCDIVLFLEAKLPDLDMTVRFCTLIPSNYSFGIFVDVTQFHGPESSSISIKKNDIITKPSDLDTLKSTSKEITISYLRRPFGRPNRIPADERGWLYAERITIAVKVATAGQHRFDEIVWSNNKNLRKTIYEWMRTLLIAARKHKIGAALEIFKLDLQRKRFTRSTDSKIVGKLVNSLVSTFSRNWENEKKKQENMSARVRELFLRWGEFTDTYITRARLLKRDNEPKDGWMLKSLMKLFAVIFLTCIVAMIPFVSNLTDSSLVSENVWFPSMWLGGILAIIPLVASGVVYGTLCDLPVGWHTPRYGVFSFVLSTIINAVIRNAAGKRLLPFMFIVSQILGTLFLVFLSKIRVCKERNQINGRYEYVGIDYWIKFPSSKRLDSKFSARVERLKRLNGTTIIYSMFYPLAGIVFINSAVYVQLVLVPFFFAFRSWYEIMSDKQASKIFGSDAMLGFSFLGAIYHEVVLMCVIVNVKHPVILAAFVGGDALENIYCLLCLLRVKRNKLSSVSPTDDHTVAKLGLTRRSSRVQSLIKDLKSDAKDGTALFISATLLQRELIETFVPVQGAIVMSAMYFFNKLKSNTIVPDTDDDMNRAMKYLSVDFAIEIMVFALTVLVLKHLYPNFSSFRIVMGIVRESFPSMLALSFLSWLVVLTYQNVHSGMDFSLKFEWLYCDIHSNLTIWNGGFDWDC